MPSPHEHHESPSVDDIARQRDFVHGLARRLLADHGRAADVAQNAIVAAVEKRPRGDLRNWLAAVVRKMAATDRRSHSRRVARERRVARRDETPSTADIVEREQWRQRILAAVESLPASQREVVLLRYFEGLPPRRIARRLNLPATTVKARLKRGLEELGPKLEKEHGSDETLSGLALVAIAPALYSTLGLTTGLGMTSAVKWKTGAAVALTLAVALVSWNGLSAPDGVASEQPVSEGLELSAAGGTTAPPPTPSASTSERVDAVPVETVVGPVSNLTGTVVTRSGGSPISGVKVELVTRVGSFHRTTDEQGRFLLELGIAHELVEARVSPGPRTGAAVIPLDFVVVPGTDRDVALEVGAGATIHGRVVDAEGHPVAGADVRGWCRSRIDDEHGRPAADRRTSSDANGRFSLHNLGSQFFVEARASGWQPATALRGTARDGAVIGEVELSMVQSRDRFFVVVDTDDRPVPRASVKLRPSDPHGTEALTAFADVFRVRPFQGPQKIYFTDAKGRTRVPGLPELEYEIDVESSNHRTWSGWLTPDGKDETRVVLESGVGLGGRVEGSDGLPVADALVHLRTRTVSEQTSTNQRGEFRLDHLRPHMNGAWLSVQAQGYAAFVLEPVHPGADDHQNLVLTLEDARSISGTVLHPDGSPAVGSRVELTGDRIIQGEVERDLWRIPTWESQVTATDKLTDEKGRFRFDGLYDGAFEVGVTFRDLASGIERRRFFKARSGDEDLELVLDPLATNDVVFEGRVTDALTGRPLEEFTIIVLGRTRDTTFNSPKIAFLTDDGRFELGGLQPMTLGLYVQAEGYRTTAGAFEERDAGRISEDIELIPARHLQVRVVDQNGAPVDSAIMASDAAGNSIWLPQGERSRARFVHTDSSGLAILHDLPATKVTISVSPNARSTWPEEAQSHWEFDFDLVTSTSEIQELSIEVPK